MKSLFFHAPVVLIVAGCVLFVGAITGMNIAGYVIDEQKIDPGDSLLPLWFSFLGGPVVAAIGAGWLVRRRKS
ncbi:hypothetical protein [Paenarthrobacter sp. A20]|uniref:hypothetical protein n=1 Tax=Paenarthrobacter sp. A20 TaxID=2817891 RepID=UPI00209D7277|nr:hypothetical protein [Paenarthrobacter sp. A20]MCP1412891.1 hypothetical protein [Paenarthrobacter sp. A20]